MDSNNDKLIKFCINKRISLNPIIWSTIIIINSILLSAFSIVISLKQKLHPEILYFLYFPALIITIIVFYLLISCLLKDRNTNENRLNLLCSEPKTYTVKETINIGRSLNKYPRYVQIRENWSMVLSSIHVLLLFVSFIIFK